MTSNEAKVIIGKVSCQEEKPSVILAWFVSCGPKNDTTLKIASQSYLLTTISPAYLFYFINNSQKYSLLLLNERSYPFDLKFKYVSTCKINTISS